MNKAEILQCIIAKLSHDLNVLFTAAKSAHVAATHAENIPDYKYETLALDWCRHKHKWVGGAIATDRVIMGVIYPRRR